MGGVYGFDDIMNPFLYDKDEHEKVVEKLHLRGVRDLEEFTILNEINRGSFGVVYRAHDKRHGEMVAMKKERHGGTTLTTEIKMMKSLPPHPNIVQFKGVAVEPRRRRHVLVVTELMDYDLHSLRAERGIPFSLVEMKYIMREVLEGVKFLHGKGIMHRDLKPGNILVSDDNRVKICDLGLAARVGAESGGVGTRFYKAPEVLWKKSCSCSGAMDIWSVGCVMAEMALDKPLFQGRWDADQLACIRTLLRGHTNELRLWMNTNAAFSTATDLTPTGLHLLEKLLAYHPTERISAADALEHPWFTECPLPPTNLPYI